MSSTNVQEQTTFIKEQLDKIYYEGFYDQMLSENPNRLSREINFLTRYISDPNNKTTT